MNKEPKDAPDESEHDPVLGKLTDAELVKRVADLQATVNAHLKEISRRLGDQKPRIPEPPDAAQETADKNKVWGGVIKPHKKGRVIE